jgi:hypothetical protein
MAYEYSVCDLSFNAENDLSSSQYRCCELSAADQIDICDSANEFVLGILQNTPEANETATVRVLGVSKASADAAISRQAMVGTSADGQVTAVSTAGNWSIGIALEAATAAANIISVLVTGPNLVS